MGWRERFRHRLASSSRARFCSRRCGGPPRQPRWRWRRLGLFALNPNLLYLQSTPMTEPVSLACLMALLYFTVLFRETQSFAAVVGAGVASLAASLTRYEGWFLIPFVAVYFLFAARRQPHRVRAGIRCDCRARPALLVRAQLVRVQQSARVLQRTVLGHEHLPASARTAHSTVSRRSRLAKSLAVFPDCGAYLRRLGRGSRGSRRPCGCRMEARVLARVHRAAGSGLLSVEHALGRNADLHPAALVQQLLQHALRTGGAAGVGDRGWKPGAGCEAEVAAVCRRCDCSRGRGAVAGAAEVRRRGFAGRNRK